MAHYYNGHDRPEFRIRAGVIGDADAFVAAVAAYGPAVSVQAKALVDGVAIERLNGNAAVLLYEVATALEETALAQRLTQHLDSFSY